MSQVFISYKAVEETFRIGAAGSSRFGTLVFSHSADYNHSAIHPSARLPSNLGKNRLGKGMMVLKWSTGGRQMLYKKESIDRRQKLTTGPTLRISVY